MSSSLVSVTSLFCYYVSDVFKWSIVAYTVCFVWYVTLCLLTFLFLSFFFSSKKSKYTSRVNLQGAKLIICQWFAPFLFKSPELMTMSPFKSQNLLPWIYKTGPLIWVTIALLSPSLSLNSRQQTKAKKRYEG